MSTSESSKKVDSTTILESKAYLLEYSRRVREQMMKNDQKAENPKDRLGMKKPALNLVPPASKIYQALAMADGAVKYGPYNWRENKVIASIYIAACQRHLDSWYDGEECAEDSGVPHLAHALACIGIIVDALETGNLKDDRPKKGSASALIKKNTKTD